MTRVAKLLLIGDGGCGKSSLIHWMKFNSFNMKYIPSEHINVHHVDYGGQSWEIIDTAGQEKYMYGDYVNNLKQQTGVPDVVLVFYDCTSHLTYRSVESWIQKVKDTFGDQVKIKVIANKVDVQQKKVEESNTDAQISCKTGLGIPELFASLHLNLNN